MRAQAKAKLGKPVALAIMNAGGLRKNEIPPVNCAPATSSSCCRLKTHWLHLKSRAHSLRNCFRSRRATRKPARAFSSSGTIAIVAEFLSGKLVDESGKEQEIDPQKIYTIVTIDYLLRLGSGAYAILRKRKARRR